MRVLSPDVDAELRRTIDSVRSAQAGNLESLRLRFQPKIDAARAEADAILPEVLEFEKRVAELRAVSSDVEVDVRPSRKCSQCCTCGTKCADVWMCEDVRVDSVAEDAARRDTAETGACAGTEQ